MKSMREKSRDTYRKKELHVSSSVAVHVCTSLVTESSWSRKKRGSHDACANSDVRVFEKENSKIVRPDDNAQWQKKKKIRHWVSCQTKRKNKINLECSLVSHLCFSSSFLFFHITYDYRLTKHKHSLLYLSIFLLNYADQFYQNTAKCEDFLTSTLL
jgi:hypothetical protein